MKKFIAILLVFTVCCGLCACGAETLLTSATEEIVLPTKPQQVEVPTQPIQKDLESGTGSANEDTEAINPTGETYPWETEFNEEDYDVFQFPGQISYRIGGLFGREVRNVETFSDGLIIDNYYYPSSYVSHSYCYHPDGTFIESHCLDNGYTDASGTRYSGVRIYQKIVNPDGSWNETHFDENDTVIRDTTMNIDGTCREIYYFKNGNQRLNIESCPAKETRCETEFYESGNMKCAKIQTPLLTQEEYYSEEGYPTYFYLKDAGSEIELTADETGKLVNVIVNGETIDDAVIITQYANDYHFRQ